MKELQALLGNKQGRLLLIIPVVLQTALFPFATTLEVQNSTIGIYNEDQGSIAIELVQRLSRTAAFTRIVMLYSEQDLRNAIDNQKVLMAIRFPADFSRQIMRQQNTAVQIILDGRHSNSGQIASNYVAQIVQSYALERSGKAATHITVRNVYNPNLNFKWHVLPSLVAIITTIGCLVVTALSVAREREEGTFDQLLVSPLTPGYIMFGKAIPGILVAIIQGSFIALVAVFIYQVPLTGSLLLLLNGMVAYGLALSGIGLFISSFSSTQQQAFLGVFFFMVPAVILSGYVTPIENMPLVLQWLAQINPLTHFIIILKGVFLKSFGFREAWPYLRHLLEIAFCTLIITLYIFRRHIV